jgi:hypothetical protein
MTKREENEELLRIKQEEEEYLKEVAEMEESIKQQLENEELEFTCKVMQAIKTSIEITPEGREYPVGDYDFSGVFHTIHGEFSGFYSDYVNIPKNKIVLQNDGTLIAEVLEDGSNFLISHNDPKYKEWKQGKRQLWKARYVFRIKLNRDTEDTYENIKEKLKF